MAELVREVPKIQIVDTYADQLYDMYLDIQYPYACILPDVKHLHPAQQVLLHDDDQSVWR
jgi:hypothetical protein